MTVPASMGSAIGINFQPTGGGKAAITGDFVLGSELEPVIKALRDNGIEVTAIHNHMVDEQPGCSSCISGRMMMPRSWPRVSGRRSTTSTSRRVDP